MPTGPSHSSGGFGGGGSHGGGFSSGGGFSHGGGNFGGHRRPTGPRTLIFFGHRYIIPGSYYSSAVSLISLFIFFAIFSVFMGFMSYSNSNDIKEYKASQIVFEEDAEFFSDLITKARNEETGYYITTATFDGINLVYQDGDTRDGIFFYDYFNNIPYYFIQYEYVNAADDNNVYLGSTYAQFSSSAANNLVVSGEGKIEVAYTYFEGSWWSINTSYSLNNNIEYKLTVQAIADKEGSQKILIGALVFFIVAALGCVTGSIFKLVNGAKKAKMQAEYEEQKQEAELKEAKARADEASAEAEKKQGYVCAYCGSDIPAGETKCPTCGSSKRVKKTDLNK